MGEMEEAFGERVGKLRERHEVELEEMEGRLMRRVGELE